MDKNDELLEKKLELRRKIQTMEWDKQLKQINFAHLSLLENFKKELVGIEAELAKVEVKNE